MTESTVGTIMETLEQWAREKRPVSPQEWLEAASKLNVLLQNEQERKYVMESLLAKMKAAYLTEGQTAAFAKSMMEASDEWLDYKKQCALVERALETIRLAKGNARLSSELMRHALD